jgi:hypothetical protein
MAHLCHINPNEVDALRLLDFAQLVLEIDAYRAQMKAINDANQGS